MRMHYNSDALVDFYLDDIPDTTQVVNPAYRELDSKIHSINGKLTRRLSQFGAINLKSDIEAKKVKAFEQKKATLLEEITEFQNKLEECKNKNSDKAISGYRKNGCLPCRNSNG